MKEKNATCHVTKKPQKPIKFSILKTFLCRESFSEHVDTETQELNINITCYKNVFIINLRLPEASAVINTVLYVMTLPCGTLMISLKGQWGHIVVMTHCIWISYAWDETTSSTAQTLLFWDFTYSIRDKEEAFNTLYKCNASYCSSSGR